MYRRFQDRFGTTGLIVAVVALIAALSGTALAASGALTGKQKKEVEKIAKKYAGKDGAPGAAGTNGTNGTNGKDGANGSAGAPGKDGTSATVVSFTGSKGTCTKEQGGIEVKSASATTFVCNGEEGEPGESPFGTSFAGNAEPAGNPCAGAGGTTYTVESVKSNVCNGNEGSPWTAGGTLPPGATETGTWAFTGTAADTAGIRVPISFPIKLSEEIGEAHVHFSPIGLPACPGTFENPGAAPGELCVFVGNADTFPNFEGVFPTGGAAEQGASRAGAVLTFGPPTENTASSGTFAVTGCSPSFPVGDPNKCP
jgi:Collagen triple helix repeat (20 copies)